LNSPPIGLLDKKNKNNYTNLLLAGFTDVSLQKILFVKRTINPPVAAFNDYSAFKKMINGHYHPPIAL